VYCTIVLHGDKCVLSLRAFLQSTGVLQCFLVGLMFLIVSASGMSLKEVKGRQFRAW